MAGGYFASIKLLQGFLLTNPSNWRLLLFFFFKLMITEVIIQNAVNFQNESAVRETNPTT